MTKRNDLLNEVKKAQRRASAKVSRLEKGGVRIRDSQFDPRKSHVEFRQYGMADLRKYLNELGRFTNRANGFVPGKDGTPIRRATWNRYRRQENTFNDTGDSLYESVVDTYVPYQGMTIGERDDTIRPRNKRLAGQVASRIYEQYNRLPESIVSEDAAQTLARDMERRNQRGYLSNRIRKQREGLNKMLQSMGANELVEKANALSPYQFEVAYNYTRMVNDVAVGFISSGDSPNKVAFGGADAALQEGSIADAREALEWAKTLPKKRPRKSSNQKRLRR